MENPYIQAGPQPGGIYGVLNDGVVDYRNDWQPNQQQPVNPYMPSGLGQQIPWHMLPQNQELLRKYPASQKGKISNQEMDDIDAEIMRQQMLLESIQPSQEMMQYQR